MVLCVVLGVSRSGFYDWLTKDHETKTAKKQKMIKVIAEIHLGSHKTYGSPRIYKVLKGLGYKVSKSNVERLMQESNIKAKTKKKFKVTTDSNHKLPVAPNHLNQDFTTYKTNQVWLSDITYISTKEGWLYLATIMDLHSRKIIGWQMSHRMTQDLVTDALNMALKHRRPASGLIHHSDRGSQYASHAYRQKLNNNGIICSMSRKGNCWDNSPMESFFHSLKTEYIYFQEFQTRLEAKSSIFWWIEVFYNRKRIHSSLGYKTPIEYEEEAMLLAA